MVSGLSRPCKHSIIGRASVRAFSRRSHTVNKKRKKCIREYSLKSAIVPSNLYTNSNGLHEQNVRLNPFVKPLNNNKIFPSAQISDTATSLRAVGAYWQNDDSEFSRSNKSALENVETQCNYDVSVPYQQNNDKFASKQRLDKHCSFRAVCNKRTLY